MQEANKKKWRAWVIKRNRFDTIVSFIKESVPEIDQYFYPQVKKEYKTKKGTKVKESPLYEGYIFLRYDNHAQVFHKLNQYPFITTFAGLVSDEEIARMEEAQGKLISEIKASRFKKGDCVKLLAGPFKDFEGTVIGHKGDNVRIKIDVKILGQEDIELFFKEGELERKSELHQFKVQDIRR